MQANLNRSWTYLLIAAVIASLQWTLPLTASVNKNLEISGFVKADVFYDNSRVNSGNFALWVDSELVNSNDSQFGITANQSRMRFIWNSDVPEEGDSSRSSMISRLILEHDFYGGGSDNSALPRMRLAWLTLENARRNYSFSAGQNWDIISPLNPFQLNFLASGFAGNLGIRRPQIRLDYWNKSCCGDKTGLTVGLSRSIGRATPGGRPDSGLDSARGALQGRIYWESRQEDIKHPLKVGVSGHYGHQQYDYLPAGDRVDLNSWSGNLDLQFQLASKLKLNGELWRGSNLDTYMGGVNQGIVVTTLDNGVLIDRVDASALQGTFVNAQEIMARGGWLELNYQPDAKLNLRLGSSLDNITSNFIPAGARSYNKSHWFNFASKINSSIWWGGEFAALETGYQGQAEARANRIQFSVVHSF